MQNVTAAVEPFAGCRGSASAADAQGVTWRDVHLSYAAIRRWCRARRTLVVLVGLLFLPSGLGATEWVNIGSGFYSGSNLAVGQDDTVWVGVPYAVWKLPPAGVARGDWVNTSFPAERVSALAIGPDGTVYAAVEASEVYMLPPGNNTWEVVGTGQRPTGVRAFAMDAAGTLYAASYKLYKLAAGSTVWEKVCPDSYCWGDAVSDYLAVDPDGTLYTASTHDGVYRLRAGTTTWEQANAGLENRNVIHLAVDPVGTLFAATGNGGVFRLRSGRTTWEAVGTGLPSYTLAVAADRTGGLYAGGPIASIDGVYGLPPESTTWTKLGTWNPTYTPQLFPTVRAVAVDASGNLFAGTTDGVLMLAKEVAYPGSAVINQFGCSNHANNGTFTAYTSLSLSHRGSALRGAGDLMIGGVKRGALQITGTLDASGNVNGTFTTQTMWTSAGTFTGTLIGATLAVNAAGAVTSGETCQVSATISAVGPTPPPGVASLVSPSGSLATTTPTYTWNAVATATRYQLWVNDSTGVKFAAWYTAAEAGCPTGTGVCAVTPPAELAAGGSRWHIQPWNASGHGPWSPALRFTAPAPPPSLLWQHATSGDVYLWTMDGLIRTGGAYLAQGMNPWRVVATADLTADGKPDLLWQHATSGDIYLWQMNGTTQTGGTYLARSMAPWKVVATGDFCGHDGSPDLAWQHETSGDVYLWCMNGTSITSGQYLAQGMGDWKLVAVADLNNDGSPDLVWQHATTGDVYVWFMTGTSMTGGTYLAQGMGQWQLVSTADLNADGHPDLVWQDATTSDVYVWLLDGTSVTSGAYLARNMGSWKVVGPK